jgi:predicted SprT family Zn-dependent metalloprotease
MKHKLRLLIFIVAVFAWLLAIGGTHKNPITAHAIVTSKTELDKKYAEYNEIYFGGKLPADTVIDHSESVQMASTMKMSDGRFHIAFNDKYTLADRVARLVLLHEQCHIKTWTEQDIAEHGPRWRTCMLALDLQGVFRREWIDDYNGQ